jgi:hypothetical protein
MFLVCRLLPSLTYFTSFLPDLSVFFHAHCRVCLCSVP